MASLPEFVASLPEFVASLPEFVASLPEFVASIRASLRCALAAVVADSASMSDGAADSVPDPGLDSGLGSGLDFGVGSGLDSGLGSGSVSLGPAKFGDAGDGGADESETSGVSSDDICSVFITSACAKMATKSWNVI